ncbi:MAG TPA: wax ester/triacylglycerol synthase domain-containing protein [Mycobacterium sp.]|uniref:wax ester/triacylglycerol synthase domain-containing protein n=1 Tax=Mycobacterium sp. TaxID=1785 RepID=UPI002D4F1E95|nr:wax ester/triacylglycerol synthase domain-containing protein [Mycobacterium sp.]HXY64042.1 wax ester/triacylglycerol synthase domain-containing protein [Mycobacterium sp.]
MTADDDLAATWGGPSEFSAWEAVMWRAEGDHRTRSAGVVLEILESEPDWERLFAAHQRLTDRIPRLQERVVEPPVPLVTPVWSPDPHFDLGYHLQRIRLPEGGSFDDLHAIAGVLAARPLDPQRPPWEAMLVGGLPEGRAAFLFKGHHSLTDGLGMLQLIDLTHGYSREPSKEQGSAEESDRRLQSPSGVLVSRLASQIVGAPEFLARQAAHVLDRLSRDPLGTTRKTIRFGRSLGRVLAPPSAPRSPLLREGGTNYRFITIDVPLPALKAAARVAGGTVNDAFLAGLLGGVRRYHEKQGVTVELLPMAIPVSIRNADDPMGGNRFAAARFVSPVGEEDPRARIATIHRFITEVRKEPALGFIDLIAPVLSVLPAKVLTPLAAQMTTANDLQASNMGGVGRTLYMAGAKVLRLYVVGPRPGVAAMATMLSYDGTCCIGVNFDPDAITYESEFLSCLQEGFDEVLHLAGRRHRGRGNVVR